MSRERHIRTTIFSEIWRHPTIILVKKILQVTQATEKNWWMPIICIASNTSIQEFRHSWEATSQFIWKLVKKFSGSRVAKEFQRKFVQSIRLRKCCVILLVLKTVQAFSSTGSGFLKKTSTKWQLPKLMLKCGTNCYWNYLAEYCTYCNLK